MSHRRHLVDDLLLPDLDSRPTVQVGHSPLPFEESDCDLPVRIAPIPLSKSERSIETLMVPRRALAESAPTVLLRAAEETPPEPSGLIDPAGEPPRRSPMMFVLVLFAISLASLAAGVLVAHYF